MRVPRAIRIESSLYHLAPNASLHLDTDGRVYQNKDHFFAKRCDPLVSFTRAEDGQGFRVYPGLPPCNDLRLRFIAAPGQEPVLRPIAREGFVARSGDTIYLGNRCRLEVPSRIDLHPVTPDEYLAQLLALSSPGETVEIGRRAIPSCPESVSRIHCTVQVLSRNEKDDGTFFLRLQVYPGMPPARPVFILREGGWLEEISAELTLAPGTTLFLGEAIGDVRMP